MTQDPEMQGADVLVTGGAGLIGQHLVARLLGSGARVTCLDDLSTGSDRAIRPFLGHPRFRLLRQGLTDPIAAVPDRIYHLACPASPRHYLRDPARTLESCVAGTAAILDLAARSGARVLFTSTSEVSSRPVTGLAARAAAGALGPADARACYSEGKRLAEELLNGARAGGTEIRVCRLSNVYGPGLMPGDGRVIPAFIEQALAGRPITVAGEGAQIRYFSHVADVVRALTGLMACASVPDAPVEIGTPHPITILGLARLILELTGSRSEIRHGPAPATDPPHPAPDLREIGWLIGWRPEIALADGLVLPIAEMRRALSAETV